VIYENGALFSVTNALGYPDDGAGSNEQCMTLWFEGEGKTGMIKHDDHYRGVSHSYLTGMGSGGTHFNFVNPDFFRLAPWDGEGYMPIGYGYDSVAAIISAAHRIESEVAGQDEAASLATRRQRIEEIDKRGIIATPANSSSNELVVEAARLSITHDGLPVKIVYGDQPHVALRK